MTDDVKGRWIEAAKWASVVLAAVGLAVGLHSDVRDGIARNAICCEESRAYRIGHDHMDGLQQHQIDYAISRIDALSSVPASRPDPFTGTEGRELERRINAIERRLEAVEHGQ